MSSALLSEWSRLLLGSLARAGVTDAVLSPGSRSTPFTWAALNEPKLHCHWLIDERVAAFFALGQARRTGRPSLLLCTSGSAAANYYPALIEASLARVPMLVLTADRPFELQHAGAPQAIDQIKLFGDAARGFFELGLPDDAPSALEGVLRSVAHAVELATFPTPGPVHLNVRARKPLEPLTGSDERSRALGARVDGLLKRGPTLAAPPTLHADVSRLVAACAENARGLIVVGPHPPWQSGADLLRLAELTGFPVLCEASSQLRFGPALTSRGSVIDAFDWLFRCERLRERLRPDLILSFGSPPTSAGYERLLSGYVGRRFVIAPHGFPDPHGLATELVRSVSADAARAVTSALEARASELDLDGARKTFRDAWRDANAGAWRALEHELLRPSEVLSEARAVRSLLEHVPASSTLVLGNSLPIRDVDAYVPAAPRDLSVLSQRGANGIDGLVSGAAGAGSLSPMPTTLILGDVSFMHDLGGLAAARLTAGPFAVVVVDNGGGRIFEQLPIFEHLHAEPTRADFWLTPPAIDLSHAAALFGHRYTRVTRDTEISEAMRLATSEPGVSIVHVVVGGSSARESEARVRAALEQQPDATP